MKFVRFLLLICILVFPFSSCHQKTTPESPEKLFETYRKSVVLVRNQFYLEARLSNGYTVYLADGTFTMSEDEAKANPMTAYGTGFFISKDGKIATNRHVAYPDLKDEDILGKMKDNFDEAKENVAAQINTLADSISEISNYIEEHSDQLSAPDLENLNTKKDNLIDQKNELAASASMLDFDKDQSKIIAKPVSVSIAYDNTFVDKDDSYHPCVILEKSNTEAIDLAILQLKDQTTPSTVEKIFTFDEHNPNVQNGTSEAGDSFDINKQLSIDKKLYMIGFNYGESMAKTTNGLKVQFTQGTVSQESDEYKVLYSIPSLPGSSGSPVIDQWGNLVAINYAGVTNSQSFNFGILAKHLKNMMMNESSESSHRKPVEENTPSPDEASSSKTKIDYEAKITDFVTAESSRNFEDIYAYFSPNMRRYWDLKNPSKAQLKNRYEHSWNITSQSENEILSIKKIDVFTYDLYALYKFTNQKGEAKELKTVVRFEFDGYGKIVETYGR